MTNTKFRRILKYETLQAIRQQFLYNIEPCTIGSLPMRLKAKDRDRTCVLFDEELELKSFNDILGMLMTLETHYILDRLIEMGIDPIEYYEAEDCSDVFYVVAKKDGNNYGFYLSEYVECYSISFECMTDAKLADMSLLCPANNYSGSLLELLDILRHRR